MFINVNVNGKDKGASASPVFSLKVCLCRKIKCTRLYTTSIQARVYKDKGKCDK
jgi:hypothetical protein